MERHFDVLIIGGGPAGLSAAQVLGRQRRRVLVVDHGQRRNALALGVHMLLGREGTTPDGLVGSGRQELRKLATVSLLSAEATGVQAEDSKLLVAASGLTFSADYLVLATGVVDRLPPIAGIGPAFGTRLFHCPLCDGFEFRDQPLVVIGGNEHAAFMAAYVRDRISQQVQLCCNGKARFTAATRSKLERHGIQVLEEPVAGVEATAQGLTLTFIDSPAGYYRAGYLSAGYRQRSSLARDLGCRLTDDGRVAVDHFQRSSVPRVFAVGDMARNASATGNMTFVGTAIASGLTAAAFLDEDIFARSWEGSP